MLNEIGHVTVEWCSMPMFCMSFGTGNERKSLRGGWRKEKGWWIRSLLPWKSFHPWFSLLPISILPLILPCHHLIHSDVGGWAAGMITSRRGDKILSCKPECTGKSRSVSTEAADWNSQHFGEMLITLQRVRIYHIPFWPSYKPSGIPFERGCWFKGHSVHSWTYPYHYYFFLWMFSPFNCHDCISCKNSMSHWKLEVSLPYSFHLLLYKDE